MDDLEKTSLVGRKLGHYRISTVIGVIRRCLEKDPRHRMQTARDVGNEFRDLARTASRPTPALSSATRTAATDSGNTRAALREDEGFWVAVLPFKYAGSNVPRRH